MAKSSSVAHASFTSFAGFWPFYLSEHSNALNRRLHFFGTTLVIITAISIGVTRNPLLIPLLPVVGYGPAWFGHFRIERNRPASFKHPLWSLMGDFKMYFWMLTGRL